MYDNADYDQSREPLSERVLAAIRERWEQESVSPHPRWARMAAEAVVALVVADRLALTTQIKALLAEKSQEAWNEYKQKGDRYSEGFADGIERVELLLSRLPGLAPTSEQPGGDDA